MLRFCFLLSSSQYVYVYLHACMRVYAPVHACVCCVYVYVTVCESVCEKREM